ncbi:PilN domain-containing protein [Novosphingobium sp.]|uniref:PilN domain-containing protein n=1 Tax=Novosphingobium sp. TaxID=1874826 RepID=UPI001D6FB405|nr:PilN domain-containing protein [Novosphingobium sp.]MBX9665291.1 PilN domain-containing protein [Novosphingobium sp.]
MTLSELLNADMTTLARMARLGFDLWMRELEGLLPAGLVRGRNLTAWHRYEHGAVIAASGSGADTLVIPQELCLVRTLTLPRLPQADLAALIALDADRIMPVAADSIVIGVRIVGPAEEAAGGTELLRVQVGALPIVRAREMAEAARAAGVSPAQVGPLDAAGERLDFDLAPAMRQAGLLPQRPAVARFWWAVVAVLVLVNIGTAVLRDQQQVTRLQALVDAQAPALNAVRRIEDRVIGNARVVQSLNARRTEHQPLRLMARVGSAMPERAWIQRFEWDGKTLRLSGYAAPGVKVVAALKASGLFASVRASRAEAVAESETGRPFELVLTPRKEAGT